MPTHSPLNLLFIDQESISSSILEQALLPHDYHVLHETSLSQAIATIHSWHPDVIVINIMQASSNGWNLCHELLAHCNAPILVLAGMSDPNSIARWLDAGADDLLTRPFSSEVLVAHLQKLTRRSSRQINPVPRHPSESCPD